MKKIQLAFLILFVIAFNSCNSQKSASKILQNTIDRIDTIESIYYKQDMSRTNPRNIEDTIFRYREIYFKRLISDSIVGVKGHWYMYLNNKETIVYEDIYDGNRLIRKNNTDSIARIYDLEKFPEFRQTHFWSHNTLFGMQYEFKYVLMNSDLYTLDRLNDTIIDDKDCYQVIIGLKNKTTMPGFATKLEDSNGSVSQTSYFIDKKTNYPIRLIGESYTSDNPKIKSFIDQRYYDIEFNLTIDETKLFDTSEESLDRFKKSEMTP